MPDFNAPLTNLSVSGVIKHGEAYAVEVRYGGGCIEEPFAPTRGEGLHYAHNRAQTYIDMVQAVVDGHHPLTLCGLKSLYNACQPPADQRWPYPR